MTRLEALRVGGAVCGNPHPSARVDGVPVLCQREVGHGALHAWGAAHQRRYWSSAGAALGAPASSARA